MCKKRMVCLTDKSAIISQHLNILLHMGRNDVTFIEFVTRLVRLKVLKGEKREDL